MYILDTNVISAARRAERSAAVAAWLADQAEADLYLSVITLGEIARGIHLQETRNPDFARDLSRWLDQTVTLFADRILEFTAQDARLWGALSARIGHPGADLMIAAQGLTRNAQIVTGNVADFEPTGVRILNPF
jgi:predicted nucleic acid-binding protein